MPVAHDCSPRSRGRTLDVNLRSCWDGKVISAPVIQEPIIVGYSVNDKVVVYDRMRENLQLQPQSPLQNIIDRSMNETLARSLFTSVTALLAMLPMAMWGGTAVSSFAVPMVFGIIVAASSSVFIAAPILLFLGNRRARPALQPALNQRTAEPLEL
jgi:SecD/SecF fusion protein